MLNVDVKLYCDADGLEIVHFVILNMAPRTPRPVVTVDTKKKAWEQKMPLHNRWHPEIPHVGEVKEGELFRVETIDWTGGQILDNDSAEDMKKVDLTAVCWQTVTLLQKLIMWT